MSFLSRRRVGGALGALTAILLATCTDSQPIGPDGSGLAAPVAAIIDGSTTGSPDFYFLPPLVKNPTILGTFNPSLLPAMRVCALADLAGCRASPVAYFPPGSATVGDEQYQISWDTDGPETGPIDTEAYYQLQILVADSVMGSIDLDPQDPEGPGQSAAPPGFYAFRLGETIPVKFWLSTQVLCPTEVDGAPVIECASAVFDATNGGELTLDQEGDRLSLSIQAGALPSGEPIMVIVQRVDLGEDCIPDFDAPQFGPCFVVTTIPELAEPIEPPALVSICIDPDRVPVNVTLEQEDQLQVVRFATDGSGLIQALANVTGDCLVETAGLLNVPESGVFRYAALGINAFARFAGPQPLLAHGTILLGGLTSSFSHFRFALPGQMSVQAGDGMIFPVGASPANAYVEILVVDHEGIPVENARVHFATSQGTTSAQEDLTDASGVAHVTWGVDTSSPGEKTLTVSALGLLTNPVPPHSEGYDFTAESLTVTAIVCEPGYGAGTAVVDGTFDDEEWGCAGSLPFSANISGGSTPAVAYWMNDDDNLYLAVRVQQASMEKANSVRFDFDSDGDGLVELNDDVIGYDASALSFYDQYLTAKCVSSSQSGCGAADAISHGSAAAANAGGWTTYELSHPLTGGGVQDIARAAGDPLGFFLSLQVGNGAQGNTQVPGFRAYEQVTIR